MFERQFGLRENPFVAGHQAKFVYPSREHQEALAHLRYGIENREPFVLITGEVGTGKTTALYDVLGEWQTRVVVALITNSALTRDELLEEISLRFGVPALPGMSKPQILVQLERHLLAVRARGERAILILDEAQNLSRDLLEEIRLLSNLEVQGDKLMQVFLVGQPELEALLARPELRQLRQRIAVHYRLNPLSDADTERYIHHRLTVAGGHAISIFPSEACREVYRLTHGIPREINTVAAQAMLNAFVEDAMVVMPEHVAAVARDTEFQSVVRGINLPGEAARPAPEPLEDEEGDEDLAPDEPPPVDSFPAQPAATPPPAYGPPRLVPPPAPRIESAPRTESGPPPLVPVAPPAPAVDLPSMPAMAEHQPDASVKAAGDAGAWDEWKAALAAMPKPDLGLQPIGEFEPEAEAEPEPEPAPAPEAMPAESPAMQSVARVREELLARQQAAAPPVAPPPAVTAAPAPPPPPTPAAEPVPVHAVIELPRETVKPIAPVVTPRVERAAPPASSLPPRLRRKLEFEEEPERSGPGLARWLAIAAMIVAVVIGGLLASRFFGKRAPAPAPGTPAASAPSSEPTASAPSPAPPVSEKPATPPVQKPAPTTTTALSKPPAKSAPGPRAATPISSLPVGAIAPITVPARVAPAPVPAPKPSGRVYGVAVATFLYEDRATQERDRLASSSGLPGRVVPVTENGETSYRVVLGEFPDRASADEAASQLIEKGLADEARVLSFAKK